MEIFTFVDRSHFFFPSSPLPSSQENSEGQLGRDDVNDIGADPTDMNNLAPISFSATLSQYPIIDIAAGFSHVCTLFGTPLPSVVCWGSNMEGELGVDDNIARAADSSNSIKSLTPVVFNPVVATTLIQKLALGRSLSCGTVSFSSMLRV
jgi:hypothetical protein